MDTTAVASTTMRAWELLADLAAYGQEHSSGSHDLADRIADLVRQHLACPWGIITLDDGSGTHAVADWSIDTDLRQRFLARESELPEGTVEIQFRHADTPVGMMLLGIPDTTVFANGFLLALQNQIEMLIALQQRAFEQQQRARELYITFENANTLNSGAPTASNLARVAENTALALAADFCCIYLLDELHPDQIESVAAYGIESGEAALPLRLRELPLIRQALANHEPTLLERTTPDTISRLPIFYARSLLLQPLRLRDQAIGLIALGFNEQVHHFGRAEITVIQTLAAQMAVVIAHARLTSGEQRRTTELDLLRDLGERLNADLSFDEIITTIVSGMQSLITFSGSLVTVYQPHDQLLHVAYSSGIADQQQQSSYALSDGLTGWVARHRRILLIKNLKQAPVRPLITRSTDGSPFRSAIGLPLLIGDQLVGTIELLSTVENHFKALDERALAIIAGQAAQAISKTLRYEQTDDHLRSRLQQLKALQRISRELTATLYLHTILGFALDEALRATRASRGYIALRGYTATREEYAIEPAEALTVTPAPQIFVAVHEVDDDRPIRIIAAAGYTETEHAQLINHDISGDNTCADHVMHTGEALVLDELDHDDRPLGIGPLIAAALAVPIYYEAQIIGVINLQGEVPYLFDRDALDFTRAVADHIALAIGNEERFFEQRRQRDLLQQRAVTLTEVLRIGQELRADHSLDQVLEQIAFSVVETARFRAAAFYLTDDDQQLARFVAAAGLPLDEIDRRRGMHVATARIEALLNREYLIGQCFFVPGDVLREHAPELDLIEGERQVTPIEQEWQDHDALIVPLYSTRARLIGLLFADEPFDRQRPNRRSVEPLEIFADQAAIAIENAGLLQAARSQTEQMTALYRASAAASVSLDLDQLLDRFYGEIVAYMGTPSFFYVASYNEERDTIRFELFRNEHGIHTPRHKSEIPKSGLTAAVIDAATIFHSHDLQADAAAGTLPITNFSLAEPVRSWVGIPLLIQSRVIGVLSVQSLQAVAFSERDIQFLSTLANQLAVAMQNARLFSERERQIVELDALGRIGRVTSSTLELRPMVEGLNLVLREVLEADGISLALINRASETLHLILTHRDHTIVDVEQPLARIGDTTVALDIMRTSRPLRLNSIDRALANRPDLQGLFTFANGTAQGSLLGIPIIAYEGTTIGALTVVSQHTDAFEPRDEAFMVNVGAQMSLGVQNAQLLTHVQHSATALENKVGELSTLLQAAQVLSSSLQPNEVLDSLMELVRNQLIVNSVALWTITPEGMLRPAAMLGIPNAISSTLRVPVGRGLTGRVAAASKPLVILDVEEDGSSLYPTFNREHRYTSFMGVPVIYQGQTIGVLSVMTTNMREFSSDEVTLLAGLADQAAIALENARLFAEREQRIAELTTLNDISRAVNATFDLQQLLNALFRGVSEVFVSDQAFIALYDAERQMLSFPIFQNLGELVAEPPTPLGDTGDAPLTSRVVTTRQSLLLHTQADVEAIAPEPEPGDRQIASWLGVPIIQGDDVFGVITVQSFEPNAYDEDARRFLVTMANQAAIALNNVRLFTSEQNRRRAADTLREVAQTLTGVLDLNEIVSLILDQLRRVVSYDTASLMLREGDLLRIVASRGFDEPLRSRVEQLAFPYYDDPQLNEVVQSRRPVVIADIRGGELPSGSAPSDGTEHIRGWIGAPLLLNDEVIGVLNIDSRTISAYDEEDAQVAFALASQAAQAIRNARLFDEVRRFTAELEQRVEERTAALADANAQLSDEKERLQAVHTITLELTASLDLETTLNKALGLAAAAVDAQRGSIMLHDQAREGLICRALLSSDGQVYTQEIAVDFTSGVSLAGWVMQEREALCIADVRHDSRWLHAEGRADEVRSVIAAPLMAQDGPLGVIMLTSPHINAFRQDQVQLLTTIANEIAIVIHNATLYTVINEIALERGELWAQQREENSKNQAILQSLGEGVIVLDEQEAVVLFNPAAEQILGLPAQMVVGQAISTITSTAGDDNDRVRRFIDGVEKGLRAIDEREANHNLMLELPSPDQAIALNFAQWLGPRGYRFGSVIVLRDVTREIDADRTKREFVSNVSHELRTPLTAIKGYTDLLLLGSTSKLDTEQISHLHVVRKNTRRLMDLIADLLEIGRLDDHRVQLSISNVEIGDVIREVVQSLGVESERKEIKIDTSIHTNIVPVEADTKRLTQVVTNLVSNAVKYTHRGGRVQVTAFINPAGLLQVNVQDTGVGISPDDQKKLGRRFVRFDSELRDESGGTGLGLSIAWSLIELHGGQMWVESEPGKGSTFSFVIPVRQPEQDGSGERNLHQ